MANARRWKLLNAIQFGLSAIVAVTLYQRFISIPVFAWTVPFFLAFAASFFFFGGRFLLAAKNPGLYLLWVTFKIPTLSILLSMIVAAWLQALLKAQQFGIHSFSELMAFFWVSVKSLPTFISPIFYLMAYGLAFAVSLAKLRFRI